MRLFFPFINICLFLNVKDTVIVFVSVTDTSTCPKTLFRVLIKKRKGSVLLKED